LEPKQVKNFIVGPAHPLRGGIANFNEALSIAFNKAGVQSRIISFTLQYPDFLFPGKTQFDRGSKPTEFKVEELISSVNPLTWIKTAKRIKEAKPDYIIIRYWLPFMAPCLGTIARLVKRGTKIKVIALADNVLPHEKHFGDRLLTRYFVKSCDAFVVMSKSVAEDLKQFLPDPKVAFLPHPIYDTFGEKHTREESLQQLNLRQSYRYILFFGFIRRYKGLDLLLHAMSDRRIREMNLKLLVAGECYEDLAFYTDIIKEHEIEGQVILKADYIPASEVKNYFGAADLVVQPYRSATQSGVTQIAYHFERPMLVTEVGGLAEIVPHMKVGYVVQPDSKAIADAIVHFYTNNLGSEFSANIAIEKKRFLWSTFVEGVNDLYQELLS
jgi:D-inositol-3-phosphate glycosyltransferase